MKGYFQPGMGLNGTAIEYGARATGGGDLGVDKMSAKPSRMLLNRYADILQKPAPSQDTAQRPKMATAPPPNANDPVIMHLLVQTALIDSQSFEILSFEEVDELKQELSSVSSKISAVKRKMAMELKVRDAAQSLNRLYSSGKSDPYSPNGDRKRALGGSIDPAAAAKAEEDLAACTKRCEDIALELGQFELQASDLQQKLLRHGMGVLGYSAHGGGFIPPNPHDSVGSTYSAVNNFNRFTVNADDFDERSLYRTTDNLDDIGSVYSQNEKERISLVRDSYDARFKTRSRGNTLSRAAVQTEMGKAQTQLLANAEKRLNEMSLKLKTILQSSYPGSKKLLSPPRTADASPIQASGQLEKQLDYLDEVMKELDNQQKLLNKDQEARNTTISTKLYDLSSTLRSAIVQHEPQRRRNLDTPPKASPDALSTQLAYLEEAIEVMTEEQALSRAAGVEVDSHRKMNERYETVLGGLWDVIVSGEKQARQQKAMKRQAKALGPGDDDSDMSADDMPQEDSFTLQAFSQRVQNLHSKSTSLKEQKGILRRQIKQQRELNQRHTETQKASDAEKAENATRITDLTDELRKLQDRLLSTDERINTSEAVATEARRALSTFKTHAENEKRDMLRKAEDEKRDLSRQVEQYKADAEKLNVEKESKRALEEKMRSLQSQVDLKEANIRTLKREIESSKKDIETAKKDTMTPAEKSDLQRELTSVRTNNRKLQSDLDTLIMTKNAIAANETKLKNEVDAKVTQIKDLQKDLKDHERKIVALTTEIALSRAEADTAKGSRAQQQRSAAAAEEYEKKSMALENEKEQLRRELTETIAEFEELTKQTIENEKEREQLETMIDNLKDRVEALETELNEEKVKNLGTRTGNAPSAGGESSPASTTTQILRTEFKKMMRESRAQHMKALKAEQEERRKLESLLKSLRKDEGGKMGMTQTA